jgi:hypothetical protein
MITTPVGMVVVGFGYGGPNIVRNVVERPEPSKRPGCIWAASARVAPAIAGVGAGPPCPAAERGQTWRAREACGAADADVSLSGMPSSAQA